MALPKDVIEIKKRLQETADGSDEKNLYFEILKTLTEPRENSDVSPLYFDDLKQMWKIVEENSEDEDKEDGHWVIAFLKRIKDASNFDAYYYKNNDDKKEIIKRINTSTDDLIHLYCKNNLDTSVVLRNETLLSVNALPKALKNKRSSGVYLYEDLYSVEQGSAGSSDLMDELRDDEFVLFTDLLEVVRDRAVQRIENTIVKNARADKTIQEKLFIRDLGHHLRYYKKSLDRLLQVITLAMYEAEYSISNIHTLINGRRS